MNPLKFYIRRESFLGRELEVHIGRRVDDKWAVMLPAQMKVLSIEEHSMSHAPAFTMENDDAQSLMDALFDAGIRPTAGFGSPGQVAAIKEHLEDMRRLVFTERERKR